MDHQSHQQATVAELADAPDLGSGIEDVGVQVSSVAPKINRKVHKNCLQVVADSV